MGARMDDCIPLAPLSATVDGMVEECPPQAASDSVSASADAIARIGLRIYPPGKK
jgi:hypothetical protein